MKKTPKRKKRDIVPPMRDWPPIPMRVSADKDLDSYAEAHPDERKGLAGADDIVQWLALVMNKKSISYDELSERSGVPSRTIKKWFSRDENSRTMPRLDTIQACFEALGQSLIVSPPSVQIGHDQTVYPFYAFRQQILEEWLEQSARSRGVSQINFINNIEDKHQNAIRNLTKGYRTRDV